MRLRLVVGFVATAATMLTPVAFTATSSAAPVADFAVSDDGPYTRHDGGSDQAIAHCGNSATDPAPDNVANDGDVDSNDGGNRRQGNEPTIAIDPTNPDVIVAGWNDYCMTDLAAGWMGLGFSTDGGSTWLDSALPGYPLDDSAEGMVSPLKGRTDSGTRWSPSTTTADSSWAESRSTASCRRTAPSSWRPTRPTRVHPARPASSQGLRPHPDHRQGRGAGVRRDLPGQAPHGGGPQHGEPARGQRLLLLDEVPGQRSHEDLLLPVHRSRGHLRAQRDRLRTVPSRVATSRSSTTAMSMCRGTASRASRRSARE